MKNNNPIVIPRNHKVEEALLAANENNLDNFNNLLSVLKIPYIIYKILMNSNPHLQ
jgi:uncharacterized protein YdiU (UPF0061 family)